MKQYNKNNNSGLQLECNTISKNKVNFITNFINIMSSEFNCTPEQKDYILNKILDPSNVKSISNEVITDLIDRKLLIGENNDLYPNPEIFGYLAELEHYKYIEVTFKYKLDTSLK